MVLKKRTTKSALKTLKTTVSRPRITPPPTIIKPGKKSTSSKGLDFSKYLDFAYNSVSTPAYILFFGLATYLCYNYLHAHSKSHLFLFVKNLGTQFPSLGKSGCSILKFMLCFIPFLPAMMSVTAKSRPHCFLIVWLYYVFIPERSPYEYLIHGLIVFLIMRTKNREYRILGCVLLFVTYIMQFAIPMPAASKTYTCADTSGNVVLS